MTGKVAQADDGMGPTDAGDYRTLAREDARHTFRSSPFCPSYIPMI